MLGTLSTRAKEYPNTSAIVANGSVCRQSWTWPEFHQEVLKDLTTLANAEIRPGDVVILTGDYSPKLISMFFALHSNRNIIIPQVADSEGKFSALTRTCSPKWHIRAAGDTVDVEALEAHGPASDNVVKLQDEQKAGVILSSSGTAGDPKIMLHDLDEWVTTKISTRCRPRLRILLLLLFDHIGGLNSLINAVCGGNTVVIPKSRRAEDVAVCLLRDEVSVVPTSPSFLNLLSISLRGAERQTFPGVRLVTYGSESMPASVLRACKVMFPNAKCQETYGLSELGILGTRSKSGEHSDKFHIDGAKTEYKIVDGELIVRKSSSFYGYLNRENPSTDWFYTGDLVEVDDDNAIKIVGRKDAVINVGGEKVFPLEVEEKLLDLEEVEECRVYGETCPIMGQSVTADVVVTEQITFVELIKAVHTGLRQSLQSYKIPQKINVVEKIGLTERLKLDRRRDEPSAVFGTKRKVGDHGS